MTISVCQTPIISLSFELHAPTFYVNVYVNSCLCCCICTVLTLNWYQNSRNIKVSCIACNLFIYSWPNYWCVIALLNIKFTVLQLHSFVYSNIASKLIHSHLPTVTDKGLLGLLFVSTLLDSQLTFLTCWQPLTSCCRIVAGEFYRRKRGH